MVVIAQGDAEDFFGFVLFDDETVQVSLNVAGFVFELEIAGFVGWRSGFGVGRFFGGPGVARLGFCAVLKMLADEIGELALEFLGGQRRIGC